MLTHDPYYWLCNDNATLTDSCVTVAQSILNIVVDTFPVSSVWRLHFFVTSAKMTVAGSVYYMLSCEMIAIRKGSGSYNSSLHGKFANGGFYSRHNYERL